MKRRHLFAAILTGSVLAGCATAPGPQFSTLEAAPSDKAQLYLYRKSALYAVGATYPVYTANREKLGELYNASYLVLPLSPGKHKLTVEEGGFASPKSFEVVAEPGKTMFVEYDSSKGLLLGWGLLSGSAAKTREQALADLKDLKRAN
ncbi:MAG: DUF2846 domain-containing protein [Polaromonas sp.]